MDADTLRVKALWGLKLSQFEWDHWAEATAAGADLQARAQHTVIARAIITCGRCSRWRPSPRARATPMPPSGWRVPSPNERPDRAVCGGGAGAAGDGAWRATRGAACAAECARHPFGAAQPCALMAELAELAARGGDLDLYDHFGAEALELGCHSGARSSLAQAYGRAPSSA